MSSIGAPVGNRGQLAAHREINRQQDVRIVQQLLNRHARSIDLTSPLAENGTCDAGLIAAIEHFQERVVGLRHSDGRVDPSGRTLRALDRTPQLGRRDGTDRTTAPGGALRRGLILRPQHNKTGRHDVTGAFQPGAEAFQRLHRLPPPIVFDNTARRSDRATQVIDAIRNAAGPLEMIAYFGHGLVGSLESAGIDHRQLDAFAEAIRENCTRDAAIILYACSSGAPGGIAETLAGMINEHGTASGGRTVYGHTCSGHSFYNPFVTYYPQNEYVIPPRAQEFRAWRRQLRAGDLWARFPFMQDAEILEEIGV